VAEEAENRGETLEQKPVKIAINEIADGRLSGSLKGGQVSAAEQ
jgi:DNA-directed RNA polymerase subunit K/omega